MVRIGKLLTRIAAARRIEEDTTVALIVAIRRLVEGEQRQREFPTLWFYCNWCLHSQIERGLTRDWLAAISKTLGESPSQPWYTDKIALIMRWDQFRSELIALFEKKQLRTFLFDEFRNWVQFVKLLCAHLVGAPLLRSDMSPPDSDHRFWIHSLRIAIAGDDPDLARTQTAPGEIYLVMKAYYKDVDGRFPSPRSSTDELTVLIPVALPTAESDVRPASQ